MKLKDAITIHKPVDIVFQAWTDVEKYPEWADPVISRQKITKGPVGLGTKFHCVDKWPGRQVEFEMEITVFKNNKRFGAKWFKPMEGQWISSFTEVDDGTQLNFEIEMRLPLMMRILTPIMRNYAVRQNRKFMQSFKLRLERD